MLCGKTLVDQCKDENWWRSVIFSSDSASMGKRVLLDLNEFRLYVKIFKLVAESRGAPDGTFIGLVILDSLTPGVNHASQMYIESLRSDLESYTTTSCPQGDVTKLAEDCKGQILTCSHAYPSPQSSTPQKWTNDGG
ncbi:unnamed protein product [Sphagnum jensenii]|uniref:Uncharacterized protein n=1 Tax=Sphagnum jensenii TaxID=128206 RepID=A0ABP0VQR0_9BRYO